MWNEFFFFLQIFLVIGFSIGAARMGPLALAAIVSLEGVLANLFVLKQVELFGLTVTCTDCLAVGSILGLNLLQEYFGRETAKKTVNISFYLLTFFVILSQIHLWYAPSPVDRSHGAFAAVLSAAPRIVFASAIVYYLVQKIDVVLFGWFKDLFQGRLLAVRMTLSLLITQLIDTVLFSFSALYGIVSSVFDIIIVSFTVKCLIILCSASLTALARRIIQENKMVKE